MSHRDRGYPCDVIRFEAGDLFAYQGEFGPGWSEDWVLFERARLEMLFMKRAHQAAFELLDRGQIDRAEELAHAMLRIEPEYPPAQDIIRRSLEARDMFWLAERYG